MPEGPLSEALPSPTTKAAKEAVPDASKQSKDCFCIMIFVII